MRIPCRNALSALMLGFVLLVVITYNWEPIIGAILLIAGVSTRLVLIFHNRPKTGPLSFSTDCQRCGARLRSRAGLPERACSSCGHRQSWSA